MASMDHDRNSMPSRSRVLGRRSDETAKVLASSSNVTQRRCVSPEDAVTVTMTLLMRHHLFRKQGPIRVTNQPSGRISVTTVNRPCSSNDWMRVISTCHQSPNRKGAAKTASHHGHNSGTRRATQKTGISSNALPRNEFRERIGKLVEEELAVI